MDKQQISRISGWMGTPAKKKIIFRFVAVPFGHWVRRADTHLLHVTTCNSKKRLAHSSCPDFAFFADILEDQERGGRNAAAHNENDRQSNS